MAAKRPKWTEAQIKAHIQTIEKTIEKAKRENKGERFIGITPEQIREKLKQVNSPFITFLGLEFDHPRGNGWPWHQLFTPVRRQRVRYSLMSGSAPRRLVPGFGRS